MEKIYITTDYIKLDQLLKFANISPTGGHAKFLIKNELVKYNEKIETRRGKKVYPKDIVEVDLSQDYNFEKDNITLKVLKK